MKVEKMKQKELTKMKVPIKKEKTKGFRVISRTP